MGSEGATVVIGCHPNCDRVLHFLTEQLHRGYSSSPPIMVPMDNPLGMEVSRSSPKLGILCCSILCPVQSSIARPPFG